MRFAVSWEKTRLSMKFRPTVFPLRRSLVLLSLASLAGCASHGPGPRYASLGGGGGVDPRYGVRPSPRVIADGEEVPKGGGSYMVGKPYKIAGQTYYPSEKPYSAVGTASWYGSDFHGRRTANGEIFDRESISAAHPTMPLPSYARVTNLKNSRSIIVRVNDRGPYHGGRVMDVSQRVAEALDFQSAGTARVKVDWIGRANLAGDDDRKLLATLRDDGQPATIEGFEAVMVAARQEQRRVASVARQEAVTEPPARPVVNDAPPRPVESEAMAYAAEPRPEPLSETTTVSRTDEEALDAEPVASTHGGRSIRKRPGRRSSLSRLPRSRPCVRPPLAGRRLRSRGRPCVRRSTDAFADGR